MMYWTIWILTLGVIDDRRMMYGTMWLLILGVIDDRRMCRTIWLLMLGVIDNKDDVWDHVATDTWSD